MCGSAVSSTSGVQGGAPAENAFVCIFTVKKHLVAVSWPLARHRRAKFSSLIKTAGTIAQKQLGEIYCRGHLTQQLHSYNMPCNVVGCIIERTLCQAWLVLRCVTAFTDIPSQVRNQPPRPTQPPTLSKMGNEYRPKCSDALLLGVKAGMAIMAHLTVD